MKTYRVHFRDFLNNRIDFDTIVKVKDSDEIIPTALEFITVPDYVICDYWERLECEEES